MKKTCVIFNPTARGERARKWRAQLERLGTECLLKPTTGAGAAQGLAVEALRQGCETIVAAGGDGTVNEVINGLAQIPGGLGQARLAVLPWGTVNVFAGEYGLPKNILPAWEVIRQGRERSIDLLKAEFLHQGQPHTRFFIQIGGVGFDARSVELVNWSLKQKFGYAAYVMAVFHALLEVAPTFTATIQNRSIQGELLLLGNGRFYGGRHVFFPLAKPDDGLFDVAIYEKANVLQGIKMLWGLIMRRQPPCPPQHYFQCRQLQVTSHSITPFQLEGEAIGHAPATFSVDERKLRFVAP